MDKKKEVKPKEDMIQCPLCGHKFSCEKGKECRGCPLAGKTCKAIRCPNCGHEIPILK